MTTPMPGRASQYGPGEIGTHTNHRPFDQLFVGQAARVHFDRLFDSLFEGIHQMVFSFDASHIGCLDRDGDV